MIPQLFVRTLIVLISLTLGLGVGLAAAPPHKQQTNKPAPAAPAAAAPAAPGPMGMPGAPAVNGSAYLLVDYHSGRVLAESNADNRLDPASLTKIMTAHVVFRELKKGNIKLDDQVLVSAKAWRTGGSKTFIEVDKKIPLEVLLKGMIIQSGNDASVALAEHIAGGEDTFAKLMNSEAQRLGMTASHFMNATGLPDPNHYSTARDMAKIAAASIQEYPEYYKWYGMKEFVYNHIKQPNRNRLLWRDDSVDGIKTGHTEAAGYCLVSSAQRDGMRLLSVLMGAKSEEARAVDSLSLLNYGFRFFETRKLYEAGQEVSKLRVWKGDEAELSVGVLDRGAFVTIPRQQGKTVNTKIELDPLVMAPISQGQAVGRMLVTFGDNNEPVAEITLVALQDNPLGGWWRRLKDTILLWFK